MNNKLSLLVNFVGVDKMSGALRNIIGLGGKGSKSLRALAGDAKKLTREIADYERQIRRTSGNATDLIDRQRQAMEQLEQVQRRIARQQRLAAIEADRQAMRRRGAELRSQGTENVAGGVAMSAPLIYAAKAAAEFSSGMVDIQQKAELSNAATDRMANTIVRLADAARQMPEDMRGAVDVLSGFGLDPRKAVAMVGPIGRLATAFKVDLSDGASAAYANLNNLKVPIGQTAAALDVMAAAGNAGAFEVKDMAKWFPGLTAQMQALGQRGVPAVADLSAALQIARRGAADADAAANNVQNLLSKINAPATARAFAKNFGVDLPAALKKAYAQGKTPLEAIAELTRQATKGDLTKIGYVFEDMQAQAALRSLIQDLDDFRKMRADIGKASGTTDRAFAQRAARDATVNWRAFLGTASRLAIVLGTTLLPVVTDVLGGLGSAATMVANWAQANPALAGTLMQGASALIAFKIGMGAAQFAIGTILGPIGNLIAIARKAAPVLGLLRTAFLFLGRGMLQAGIMMMANPIVLAIVAVGAAIGVAAYLIYTHWDGIKATFRAGWAFLTAGWTAFRHWISGVGGNLMDGIINGLKAGWSALKNVWNTIVSYLPASMRKKWEIHSPSRVFMRMGCNVADGLALGVDRGVPRAQASMSRLAGGVMAAGALSLTPFASAARPAAAPAATAQRGGDTYHFHITQQPGEDAEAFARRVQALIDKANDRKRRRGFEDA